MKIRKTLFPLLFVFFLAVTLAILSGSSLQYRLPLESNGDGIRTISDVFYEAANGNIGKLSLPDYLSGLEPRSQVTIHTTVEARPGESLLVKSVFAPLRLYLNNRLIYEYGQAGSYPAYLNDPPTGLAIVKLPAEGGSFNLRLEFQSLTQRSTLSLPAVFIGDSSALLTELFRLNGFSLLFSLILIFLGITMTLISLTYIRRIPAGTSFLWLGLFSLSAGAWVLGECDLTIFLLPYPSLLHAMTYMGLFCVTIALLRFGLVILNPKNKLPLQLMLWLHTLSAAAAFLLQLTGAMDFTKSVYWFHLINPLGLATFAACLMLEKVRYHNPVAKRFAPAVFLFSVSTLLELANYWLHLTVILTLFFQLGALAFVIFLSIFSGFYVRQAIGTAAEKRRLEYEMTAMERQLALQRLQYQQLMESDELVKAQRHDLRHQLAVLRSLSGDEKKLNEYIDGLTAKIPSGEAIRLCENYAVNAVAAYYYAMAQRAGIDIGLSLAVPGKLDSVAESDLCVVVGNLMENAVEACASMTGGRRFIRVNSRWEYGILTLAVDNSFAGKIRKQDGAFLSSKRPGKGTGIVSVAAVARKHGGNIRFEEKEGVFQASVYMWLAADKQ